MSFSIPTAGGGEDGGGATDAGSGTSVADPREVITFAAEDVQPDGGYYGAGAVARYLFDWTPTVARTIDVAGPLVVSGITSGVEVQVFTVDSDPTTGAYTVIGQGYGDSYTNTNEPPGFAVGQFVSSLGHLRIAAGLSPSDGVEPGVTYQVWVASYATDVGGQVDVGPVKVHLDAAGGVPGGPFTDPYGDLLLYTGAAEGASSHAEGASSHAEGFYSHAEGVSSHAEGASSHAEGFYSHAEGASSHAEGFSSHAEGNYSHAEGFSSHARWAAGHAAAAYQFTEPGDAQVERVVRAVAGDGVLAALIDSSHDLLPVGYFAAFRAEVIAEGTTKTKAKAWTVVGAIYNDAGTHTLIGAPTVTELGDLGTSGFTLTATADTANGLFLTVGGGPDRTVATIHYTLVGGA